MSPAITELAPETLVLVVRTRNTRISKSRIRHPSALQNVPDKRRKTGMFSIPVKIVSSLCFIHVKLVINYARPRKISFWAVCHIKWTMSAANSGSKVVNCGRVQHKTFDLTTTKKIGKSWMQEKQLKYYNQAFSWYSIFIILFFLCFNLGKLFTGIINYFYALLYHSFKISYYDIFKLWLY